MVEKENTQRGWQVRPYQQGDEARAVALWARVFGRSLSEEQYRWKVLESPWQGALPTVWYAVAGAEVLAGQYAGTVLRVKVGDQVRRVVHSCDAMTAPEFRRQGVLSAVGHAATAAWAGSEIAFVIGLPHSGWGSRRAYLGWQTLFHAQWWRRVIRAAPLLMERGWPRPLAKGADVWVRRWVAWQDRRLEERVIGVRVTSVAAVDERFDQLWETLAPRYEALVVRDAAWLRYRYEAAPDLDYRLMLAERGDTPVGFVVMRLGQAEEKWPTAFIVDVVAAPDDDAAWAALLRAATRWATAEGATTLRTLAPEGGGLERVLRGAAFRRAAGRYDVSAVALRGEALPIALHSPTGWYTTAGDYDIL